MDSRLESTLSAQSIVRQNPRVAQQTLGGKAVVLHYEGHKLVGLNETGSAVWTRLDATRSLGDIARDIAAGAGLPAGDVLADVLEFVKTLAERDLVVDAQPAPPAEASTPHRPAGSLGVTEELP